MSRRSKKYTELGSKIAELAKNQVELARVLGLSQQSISGKLRGRIGITIKDLATLSKHYDVSIFYFVSASKVSPDLARTLESIVAGPQELHSLVEIAAGLPRPFIIQLLRNVEAMHVTTSYYQDLCRRDDEKDIRAPSPLQVTEDDDS